MASQEKPPKEPPTESSEDIDAPVPPDSPQKWSRLHKHCVFAQCCLYGAAPGFTSAMLIPGVDVLARHFATSTQAATYLVAVPVLVLGWAPFGWNVVLDTFGRRPTLVASGLVSCVAALCGGFAATYGGLMTARIFQAAGVSAAFVVPGVMVVDMFPRAQRGRKSGLWTQMISMGAPLGGLVGGPVVQCLGWHWVLWLSAILAAAQTVGFLLSVPETSMRHRHVAHLGIFRFAELRRLPAPLPTTTSTTSTVSTMSTGALLFSLAGPIRMLRFPSVVLVALAYAVTFAITSVGLSTILPLVLGSLYHFDAAQQGAFFTGPLVGVLVGECLGGPMSDWVMNRERRQAAVQHRGVILERRLLVAIPGFLLAPVGVVIFGLTLQGHHHWVGPCIGFGIANCGLQLVTTCIKTYCVDCHVQHAAAVLQCVNVLRQTLSFTVPFWSPDLLMKVGIRLGFGIEAVMIVVGNLRELCSGQEESDW